MQTTSPLSGVIPFIDALIDLALLVLYSGRGETAWLLGGLLFLGGKFASVLLARKWINGRSMRSEASPVSSIFERAKNE